MNHRSQESEGNRPHRNDVSVAGVLAEDPKLKHTASGSPLCTFTIACTCGPYTTHVRCVAHGNLGLMVAEFHKDDYIQVVGHLKTRIHGRVHKKYAIEVVISELGD